MIIRQGSYVEGLLKRGNKLLIQVALAHLGHKAKASKVLGIGERTLSGRLKEFEIDLPKAFNHDQAKPCMHELDWFIRLLLDFREHYYTPEEKAIAKKERMESSPGPVDEGD